MTSRKYSEGFEILWSQFDVQFGRKGSKKTAWQQYKKLSPDAPLRSLMIRGVMAQKAEKARLRAAGEFWEAFPHVFRWIRDERWEDEIPDQIQSDLSAQGRLERMMDRSWAEDPALIENSQEDP